MMMPYRRNGRGAQRYADRCRRENEAPKLCSQVPSLTGLELDLDEHVGIGRIRYLWRFVVEHTPALFLVPCGDPQCDGAHDLTTTVMLALRARETTFEGKDECAGITGSSRCPRVLHFGATAEYRNAPPNATCSGGIRAYPSG